MMREVAAEEKSAAKYIKESLKTATSDEKAAIRSALDEAGQDVRQALANTQSQLETIGKQYDEFTSTLTGPPVFGESLTKSIDRQLIKLGKYGTDSKAISKEIAAKTKAYANGATERSELEMIREIKTNKQSEVSYYFDSTGLVLVQDITDQITSDSTFTTTEHIQWYDKNGLVRAWKSNYKNGAKDETAFSDFEGKAYSVEEALQMYSRTGAFQLHFEDFLHSEGDMFLLVNTNNPYNYIAAVKIAMMDDFLIFLQKDKEKYKNKPIAVNSELVDQNGWMFHYYRGGSLMK
jgi:hypothetical protein